METPVVSIVVTTYYKSDPILFERMICSLLNKNCSNFAEDNIGFDELRWMDGIKLNDMECIIPEQLTELIIMMDAFDNSISESEREIKDIIHTLKSKEIKNLIVRYIRTDKNVKIAISRNISIAEATGKFITFRDDDDISSNINEIYHVINAGSALVYESCMLTSHSPDKKIHFEPKSVVAVIANRQYLLEYQIAFPPQIGGEDKYWRDMLIYSLPQPSIENIDDTSGYTGNKLYVYNPKCIYMYEQPSNRSLNPLLIKDWDNASSIYRIGEMIERFPRKINPFIYSASTIRGEIAGVEHICYMIRKLYTNNRLDDTISSLISNIDDIKDKLDVNPMSLNSLIAKIYMKHCGITRRKAIAKYIANKLKEDESKIFTDLGTTKGTTAFDLLKNSKYRNPHLTTFLRNIRIVNLVLSKDPSVNVITKLIDKLIYNLYDYDILYYYINQYQSWSNGLRYADSYKTPPKDDIGKQMKDKILDLRVIQKTKNHPFKEASKQFIDENVSDLSLFEVFIGKNPRWNKAMRIIMHFIANPHKEADMLPNEKLLSLDTLVHYHENDKKKSCPIGIFQKKELKLLGGTAIKHEYNYKSIIFYIISFFLLTITIVTIAIFVYKVRTNNKQQNDND